MLWNKSGGQPPAITHRPPGLEAGAGKVQAPGLFTLAWKFLQAKQLIIVKQHLGSAGIKFFRVCCCIEEQPDGTPL